MKPDYKVVDSFLGINKSSTETLLELGEASDMTNWMVTDDRKLQKIFGYIHMNAKVAGQKINGNVVRPLKWRELSCIRQRR